MKILDQRKLIDLYRGYFDFKGMKWPDTRDAVDFAVTEVGEVIDALKREQPGWVRHNQRETDVAVEITQAIMMLMIALEEYGASFDETTFRWMRNKDFPAEFITSKDYVLWARPSIGDPAHIFGIFEGLIESPCGRTYRDDYIFWRSYVGRRVPPKDPVCWECERYYEIANSVTVNSDNFFLELVNNIRKWGIFGNERG